MGHGPRTKTWRAAQSTKASQKRFILVARRRKALPDRRRVVKPTCGRYEITPSPPSNVLTECRKKATAPRGSAPDRGGFDAGLRPGVVG
jgi:hypothetical protein